MQKYESYWEEFAAESQRVLLLQGPVGPFFLHFKNYLTSSLSKTVFKINFNGGDAHYYPETEGAVNYTGAPKDFIPFLADFIKTHRIDAVVCFGDSRLYHDKARDYCAEAEVSFWAFEEGYLRPHYITFEKWGVNYSSKVERDQNIYLDPTFKRVLKKGKCFKEERPVPVASGFWKRACMAGGYYFGMWRQRKQFPKYEHHREKRIRIYVSAWLSAFITTLQHRASDKKITKAIESGSFDPFYIFPLQVHSDSQIRKHGRGRTVSQYIRRVVNSFALYAPENCKLVIKHHPMDKGFSDYGKFIKELAKRKGVEDRVFYVLDIPMPVFLRNAKGMVVVNSTSGISALIHNLPVKVIGDAHYDIPGLTSTQQLANFWHTPEAPDAVFVNNYLQHLRIKTQLNGSFYYHELRVEEFCKDYDA